MNKMFMMFNITLVLIFLGQFKGWCIGVSPAAICIQGIEIGVDKDTGLDYLIQNTDNEEREFTIKVIEPIMPSDESLKGYSPIPDLEWVYLETTKLVIPANGSATSRVHIKIPKEEKYYNQAWAMSFFVTDTSKSFMKTGVAPFCVMETKAKDNVNQDPDGEIGLVPSIVNVKFKELKKKNLYYFKIYNNSVQECTYNIKSFIPDIKNDNLTISRTSRFEWIKDVNWVKPLVSKLKIKSNESKEIKIGINLPKDVKIHYDRIGMEVIIFIESDRLVKRFLRVWIVGGDD
ncbi:MAG: hypothetical protein ABH873_03940 [Candidatus Firestonebacteria bacterium]